MLAAERHELILAAVREHGMVRSSDLVERLGVGAATLRRDVTRLADRGQVVRVHGGVALPYRDRDRGPVPGRGGTAAPVRTLVGMVVPSVEYYWPGVIQGAQEAAAVAGSRLVLRASTYDPGEDRRQIARLIERGIQMLLVAPTLDHPRSAELLRWLGSLPVPVVLMERTPPPELPVLALDAVTTDHAHGAGLAVRHLAALGHRRVGLVTSRPSPTTRGVRAGWNAAVAGLGLDDPAVPDADVPAYGSPGWVAVFDAVLDQCADAEVRALLVHSDKEAIGIVERARDRAVDVPGELAVVSYDDEVAAASDPPLTAVRPDRHRLGATAIEFALARHAGGERRPVHRLSLWPRLTVRSSCGAEPMG